MGKENQSSMGRIGRKIGNSLMNYFFSKDLHGAYVLHNRIRDEYVLDSELRAVGKEAEKSDYKVLIFEVVNASALPNVIWASYLGTALYAGEFSAIGLGAPVLFEVFRNMTRAAAKVRRKNLNEVLEDTSEASEILEKLEGHLKTMEQEIKNAEEEGEDWKKRQF